MKKKFYKSDYLLGTPVDFRIWREPEQKKQPYFIQGHVQRVYRQGLVWVHVGEGVPEAKRGSLLVRGCLDWEALLPRIFRSYQMGREVPVSFRPLRRLNEEMLRAMASTRPGEWVDLFRKLRGRGFLPGLPALNKSNGPENIPWNQLKKHFHDFKGTEWEHPEL